MKRYMLAAILAFFTLDSFASQAMATELKAPRLRVSIKSGPIPYYLDWTVVENANKYQVQSSKTPDFKKAQIDSTVEHRWDVKKIEKNSTLWFRVRAVATSGKTGPWSSPVSVIL